MSLSSVVTRNCPVTFRDGTVLDLDVLMPADDAAEMDFFERNRPFKATYLDFAIPRLMDPSHVEDSEIGAALEKTLLRLARGKRVHEEHRTTLCRALEAAPSNGFWDGLKSCFGTDRKSQLLSTLRQIDLSQNLSTSSSHGR